MRTAPVCPRSPSRTPAIIHPRPSERMSDMPSSIVWFRHDLRLADNPALIAGLGSGRAVVPLYVLDEETEGRAPARGCFTMVAAPQPAGAGRLAARLGSRLIVRRGPAERVLADLAAEVDAQAVYWNRIYDQGSRERDARLKQAFMARGVAAESLKANLLFEPWEVKTLGGEPFKVFTPFWRGLPRPGPRPSGRCPRRATCRHLMPGRRATRSPRCDCCRARPTGRAVSAPPGRPARRPRLIGWRSFLDGALANYREARPAGHRRHLADVAAPGVR